MSQSVKEYYDDYSTRQLNAGIHHRHLSIQRWLEKFGMSRDHRVLEIGCGIGTQTQLMLQYLSNDGEVLAIDISEKSIEIGKKRLSGYDNLEMAAGDITEMAIEGDFDTIVLPDVLEHIPLELHKSLFKKLNEVLSDDGFILIHIPDPFYLEWVTENRPGELQVIDNPIHVQTLLNSTEPNDLSIVYLESYSIFRSPADYRIIVLKKKKSSGYVPADSPFKEPFTRRLKRKVRRVIRGK